ncbi:MAG: PEGA domain-containing protein [Planctomycetota bacterium]
MEKPPDRSRGVLGTVIAVGVLATGCAVRRELVIVSRPPGASVRLDQQMAGYTPFRTEFLAFGTRRVTLYRQGYQTWSESIPIEAPWYAIFPFDLFSEVLLPFGWKYSKEVEVDLEPESGSVTAPDLERVLDEAEVLRTAGPEGPGRKPPPKEPE